MRLVELDLRLVAAIITGLVIRLWKAEQASGQLTGRTFNLGRLMVAQTIDTIHALGSY
jgi:hypothetical protein